MGLPDVVLDQCCNVLLVIENASPLLDLTDDNEGGVTYEADELEIRRQRRAASQRGTLMEGKDACMPKAC